MTAMVTIERPQPHAATIPPLPNIPDFFNETLAHTLNPNTINKAVPTNSPRYNVKSSIPLPSSEND